MFFLLAGGGTLALRHLQGEALVNDYAQALIFHSDEALLATGFLFAIHFNNTHLRPDVFPVDPAIEGTVPLEEVAHRYPGWFSRLSPSAIVTAAGDERAERRRRMWSAVSLSFLVGGLVILFLVMSAAIHEVIIYMTSL